MNRISPVRPDFSPRSRPSQHMVRAVVAHLIAVQTRHFAEHVAAERWPDDRATGLLLKAAVSPATTTQSTWAASLASTSVADFILNLGPASAGAQLLRRGIELTFGGSNSIVVPGMLAAATDVGFVQEAAPIPVRQYEVTGPTLSPRKFATITTFTREIFSYSTPAIEAIVRAVLTESVGLALDTALFDATAGSATHPAGLRNGITTLSASTSTTASEAMRADVAALVAAVAAVAGAGPIIIVASPGQATALRLGFGNVFPFEVLASGGLSDRLVIAIAANSVASAIDAVPRIDVGGEGTLHMSDTPAAIGSSGTPNSIAAPTRSLWQTDAIGLRLRMDVSWALRHSAGLAFIGNTAW